jgi:hypothetical protein
VPTFRVVDGFSGKWKRTRINRDLPDLPDEVVEKLLTKKRIIYAFKWCKTERDFQKESSIP